MGNIFSTFGTAISQGVAAFRAAFMSSDLLNEYTFADYRARFLRYQILWSMYENTSYDRIHRWANSLKSNYGLYRYVRNIFNPSFRVGDFWMSHLLAGKLDPMAGDGKQIPSAIPIVMETENAALRKAIATLWKASNWQINKDILSLWGSVLGDAGIRVVDNRAKKRVYLKNVHPGTLKRVDKDDMGNVKGYVIEEVRLDPRKANPNQSETVYYTEVAYRDGNLVRYETYLNGGLYAWDGDNTPEWAEPYGFVPLVVIQHQSIGMDWGWSALQSGLSKFREVDDLASKLSDQIRKMVDAPWLFGGVKKNDPTTIPTTTTVTRTTDNPQAGREDVPALYGPVGATATPLVAPLQIADTSAYIDSILKTIEADYPEINAEVGIKNHSKDLSGKALRINRQPAENKVQLVRPGYDNALVRVHQMAVAIGGEFGYPGYEGFNLGSYDAGALDHSIGDRPVFGKDPLDDIEIDQAFWTAAGLAKAAGIPLLVYLSQKGWTDAQIKQITDSPEYQAKLAAMMALTESPAEPGNKGDPNADPSEQPAPPKEPTFIMP